MGLYITRCGIPAAVLIHFTEFHACSRIARLLAARVYARAWRSGLELLVWDRPRD